MFAVEYGAVYTLQSREHRAPGSPHLFPGTDRSLPLPDTSSAFLEFSIRMTGLFLSTTDWCVNHCTAGSLSASSLAYPSKRMFCLFAFQISCSFKERLDIHPELIFFLDITGGSGHDGAL
jgi:hypothetical protein